MSGIKIAEIVPLSCLELTKDNQYHMCLAHLALKNDEYASFYRRMSNEGKYVIMDNGAAENEKLDFEDLLKAYSLVNPTEIILPDVLFNAYETYRRSVDFYERYESCISNYTIMVVPQGENLKEWIKCFNEMSNAIPFDRVGIPKWLGKDGSPDRIYASAYLLGRDVKIHLLGCNENPEMIKKCHDVNKNVKSCDSAFAYLCAKAKYNHIDEFTTRPNTSIDFLNDSREDNLEKLMSDFENAVGAINNKRR